MDLPGTPMQKIFHFDSPPEPYVADAAVLRCFDERIRLTVNKFLRRQGILRPDMIVVAGGAKTLASPRNDFELKHRRIVHRFLSLPTSLHSRPSREAKGRVMPPQ